MANDSVFEYVVRLTETAFGKEGLSELDFIFGYAKLILMNSNVLDALFTEESDRNEIDKVRSIFKSKNLDPELLKSGVPLLRAGRDDSDVNNSVLESLASEKSASEALSKLLKADIPELKVMQEGKSIDDVYALAKPAAQKKGENKEKKSAKKEKGEEAESADTEKAEAQEEADPVVPDKDKFDNLVKKTTLLYECLKRKVFGQDEAIRLFSNGYFQSQIYAGLDDGKKGPSATFLFAGPPGVGKTYLASSVAEILDMPYLRLDMSEFSKDDSVQRLMGVPKTFHSPKPGELTEFVRLNPESIILLDEIEKAHIDVIYQFLQVLDGGVLTDECTMKTISFKRVILIFTTNVGKKLYEDTSRRNLSSTPRSIVMKEIENEIDERGNKVFPPAICSRFASGNVIMFNRLGVHNFIDIINKQFNEDAQLVKSQYDYDIVLDQKVAPMLLFSQSTRMDARNMKSQSSILIKNELFDLGRHVLDHNFSLSGVNTIKFSVRVDRKEDPFIDSLFVNREKTVILYVGDPSDFAEGSVESFFKSDYKIIFSDKDNVLKDIAENEISFVIINMKYGVDDNKAGYLSLDDIKSNAVVAFDLISKKIPDMPIYFVHKQDISDSDAAVFFERGAREFIKWNDDAELADKIMTISGLVYMQSRVDSLSGRGRVLTYNTAQQISGKVAKITFYDLKVELAADADEGKLLLSEADKPKDRFADVIGAEDAKAELAYFIDYFKHPKKYMAQSIKPPKGILLYGPPGTGKTMLARAMAGESDVTFIPTTATALMNKYHGESEKNIRELFATAKKFAPSIIFIDEIDAIGRTRTGSSTSQLNENMLTALLTEMDGFVSDPSKPVFVVAATNYGIDSSSGIGDGIDPALMRRFDNKIYVDLPKENEREKYINVLLKKVSAKDVKTSTIHNLAQRTTGQSLAILKNVMDLALRNANKQGKDVNDEILLNALEEYMYGERKEWSNDYYSSVAVHEAGHTYISYLSGENPSFVTIVSRGDFGGYMQHSNSEATPSYTREDLIWKIRTSLAGRAAEVVFFGEEKGVNTGVSSDIQNATRIAFQMLYSYAMSDKGLASVPYEKLIASPMADQAIGKVNEILEQEMKNTVDLITNGKKHIKKLADFLEKYNQATEEQITDIFKDVKR